MHTHILCTKTTLSLDDKRCGVRSYEINDYMEIQFLEESMHGGAHCVAWCVVLVCLRVEKHHGAASKHHVAEGRHLGALGHEMLIAEESWWRE